MPTADQHRRYGDWIAVEEVGRGGMGVVYRARHRDGGPLVALKVLPGFGAVDPAAVDRFRRESRAAARLRHEGVVPVLDSGRADGVHYFVMELVEGPSLEDLLESLRPRAPESLRGTLAEETALDEVYPVFRERTDAGGRGAARYARSCAAVAGRVAAALAAAHAGGVIHRDVKPGNVLIHPDGRLVLVDFGLAHDELTVGLTRSGDAIGTPAYMAPEQARGSCDVDARVDVYGLGALLYELLALRPPYRGATAAEIMLRVLGEDPQPVRRLNPRVPKPLATIVSTCMARDRSERYPTTAAVVEDLERFLAGRSILARPPRLFRRLGRSLARQRRALLTGAAVFAACAIAAAAAGVAALRARTDAAHAALKDARALLIGGRVIAAHTAYARAAAVLDADTVAEAQARDLRESFERLYSRGRRAELQMFLEGMREADRGAQWQRWRDRLAGRGELRVGGAGSATVAVAAVGADGEPGPWEPHSGAGELPIGEHLVRIERPGRAASLHGIVVGRDEVVDLAATDVAADEVGPATALVPDAAGGTASLISRTELDRATYARVLRGVRDEELRAELLPEGWSGPYAPGALGQPVVGISFRQARAVAALLGGHLPGPAEYQAAARAGLPSRRYPWGASFDLGRVAVDPLGAARAAPADSYPQGASPHGIVNLVGNVAEYLAPGRDGVARLAGGHYWSPFAELVLDLGPQTAVTDWSARGEFAGMRHARFAPVPDDPDAATDLAAALREAVEVHAWRVEPTGAVDVELTWRQGACSFPRLDGFTPAGEWQLRAGDSQRTLDAAAAGGAVARASAAPDAPVTVAGAVLPGAGLERFGDRYRMVVSGAAAARGAMLRLTLPPATRVDEAAPEPLLRRQLDGRPVLVFAIGGGAPDPVVAFRRDGLLTERLPAEARAGAAVAGLLAALGARDRDRLRQILDERFVELPGGRGCEDLLRDGAAGPTAEYLDPRVTDVTAVGGVVTCRLDVTCRVAGAGGASTELVPWPITCRLLRTAAGLLALELRPGATVDGGAVGVDGYCHDAFGLRVRPLENTVLQSAAAVVAPVQVRARCTGRGAATWALTATWAQAGGAAVVHRLSGGDSVLRPGRRLRTADTVVIGSQPAMVEHWLFRGPDGGVTSRERWIFVRFGRRALLIRERVDASSAEEAESLMRSARPWFDEMLGAVELR